MDEMLTLVLGHVKRMEYHCIPRQLLYSQLCEGECDQGRPGLRFKHTAERNMNKIKIDGRSWQQKVRDLHGEL